MSSITIEGSIPLMGTVTLSGAKNAALKIIPAAMYCNEDVILTNVPKVDAVLADIEIIKSIGGTAEWMSDNMLLLNGASISSPEIPYNIGSRFRTTLLMLGPLLYRFGKASIPKPDTTKFNFRMSPINRLRDTWHALGINCTESDTHFNFDCENIHPAELSFKIPSHMGTDNAILLSLLINGETIINNASEESEIDDVIAFANVIGAHVERIDPKVIKVTGTNIFKGGSFELQSDKSEAVTFSVAALLTGGNVTIRRVNKLTLIPFVNFLSKIGARYEFIGDDLKIWTHGEKYTPTNVTIAPSPGFVPDWKPLATLLLTRADGDSFINDTVYVDRNDYIRDLNRMGAKLENVTPSSVGMVPVISDDSYSLSDRGEPYTVIKISGPTRLKGEKMNIQDIRYGALHILAALAAEGKSEIKGYEHMTGFFENFFDKLVALGAKVWVQQD